MDRFELLNLLVILTVNNLLSMYVFELFVRIEKPPFVLKAVGWLTALVTVVIWTAFLAEAAGFLKSMYDGIRAAYGF